MKQCPKCGKSKNVQEFNKNRSKPDGLQNYCRKCQAEATSRYNRSEKGHATAKVRRGTEPYKRGQEKYNQTEKGRRVNLRKVTKYTQGRPEVKKAQQAVYYAVRTGRLPKATRLNCDQCGKQAKQYHHHNGYSPEHKLDVVPLCVRCHTKITLNLN